MDIKWGISKDTVYGGPIMVCVKRNDVRRSPRGRNLKILMEIIISDVDLSRMVVILEESVVKGDNEVGEELIDEF